jgi:hypothetical protein
MEIPWTAVDQPGAGPDVQVMGSRFELKTAWRSPQFFVYSVRLWRQARRSPGILGVSLRAQPLAGVFWTLSAWTSREALTSFAGTDPHATAMKRIRPWMRESTFRFWSVPADGITAASFRPADLWAEAQRRVGAAAG